MVDATYADRSVNQWLTEKPLKHRLVPLKVKLFERCSQAASYSLAGNEWSTVRKCSQMFANVRERVNCE